jgi:hypothetical protein
MTIDFEQIIEIINASEKEDIILLNENYERIVDELPDGEEKSRYLVLHDYTKKRLVELEH